ncbi:MAG: YggS family pyridoxal phosphate-dependent enzyme [Alphaproteobacteria bacterium]|nr:YggS family pyridoxal phosphate-dependent enzyme [Alphaproteobacteria bacterium]
MSVAENLDYIQQKIGKAALTARRDASCVQLVAVSKRQPQALIAEAIQAGHRVFGENRVQEAQEHWSALRGEYSDLVLHLIGPLQTNKVKEAVALFDVIETVDREKLAVKLGHEMTAQGRDLPCFIQVNTGEEPQKAGIAPGLLEDFLGFCRADCGLNIAGLMCIPPVDEPPGLHFSLLRKLVDRYELEACSMGMSGDYEKAVMAGATHVRVGTAIFGQRLL